MQAAPQKRQGSVIFALVAAAFFIYLYIQILSFDQGQISNPILGGLYFILFGIHEAAHIAFGFLPPIVTAASGSLSEIVFTVILVVASIKAKSYLATGFSLLWVMLAMSSAGRYMADAKSQLMPLIGPGANPQHDWHFVFGELGLIEQGAVIGDTLRFVGYGVGVIALIVVIWYVMVLVLRSK